MNVGLIQRVQEAQNIESFYFSKTNELTYKAGQFTKIRLRHENEDSRGDSRWFSLASSPTEDFVLFGSKFSQDGSSFKKAFHDLEKGDTVTINKPIGNFTLPPDKDRKLLFIAGGIGITPFRSIIKYIADTGEKRNISLLYVANTEEEFIYKEVLEEIEIDRTYMTELLNVRKITEFVPDLDERLIYLSGPQPMIEALFEDLQAIGIGREQLQLDYFPGYKEL